MNPMHDCSGLGPRSSGAPERWAKELTGRGYVILIPDSFTTRGHADGVCTDPSPSRRDVSPARRVSDAYAALAYAHTLSFVDPSRVGLMGGSHVDACISNGLSGRIAEAGPIITLDQQSRNCRRAESRFLCGGG